MKKVYRSVYRNKQKRLVNFHLQGAFSVADRTGLEPATSAVTGRHSNQLNYRSKKLSLKA